MGPFPSGNDVRVTEAQAKVACANIADADLRADCMTDVRMVNDPDVTDKLVDGFKTVEATDKVLGHIPVKPTTPKPVVTTKPVTVCLQNCSMTSGRRPIIAAGDLIDGIIKLLSYRTINKEELHARFTV